MADLLHARKAALDPANPPLYDAAHPRLTYRAAARALPVERLLAAPAIRRYH